MTTETMTMPEPPALPRRAPPRRFPRRSRWLRPRVSCGSKRFTSTFYGDRQALFDVSLAVPEKSVSASSVPRDAAKRRSCAV